MDVDGFRRALAIWAKIGAISVRYTDGFDDLNGSVAVSIQEYVGLFRRMPQFQIIVPWAGIRYANNCEGDRITHIVGVAGLDPSRFEQILGLLVQLSISLGLIHKELFQELLAIISR